MPLDPGSHVTAETEILAQVYAALNRGDIPGVFAYFDPDIERIEPPGNPTAGTFRGTQAVKAHFEKGRGTWAEGACEPERFIVAGEKIVVFLHVHVRLKDRTDWVEGRMADGFIFRNGKVILMQTFWEREEALAWAGVQAV